MKSLKLSVTLKLKLVSQGGSQKSKDLYSKLLRHLKWYVYLRQAVLVTEFIQELGTQLLERMRQRQAQCIVGHWETRGQGE